MPKGVLKFAPLLALGLIGYLTYSATDVGEAAVTQGKQPPSLTKAMLHPELVTPQNHASPAGRDPFEVSWSSYLHIERAGTVSSSATSATPSRSETGGGSTVKPASPNPGTGGQITVTTTGTPAVGNSSAECCRIFRRCPPN